MSQKDEDAKEFPMLVVINGESGEKIARATGKKEWETQVSVTGLSVGCLQS